MNVAERTLATATKTLGFGAPTWGDSCWRCLRRNGFPYRTIGRLVLNDLGLCQTCDDWIRQ